MPYKPQTSCFRTINGVRYENQCDILGEEHRQLAAKAKRLKTRCRIVKHKNGFKQLFVHPADVDKLCEE